MPCITFCVTFLHSTAPPTKFRQRNTQKSLVEEFENICLTFQSGPLQLSKIRKTSVSLSVSESGGRVADRAVRSPICFIAQFCEKHSFQSPGYYSLAIADKSSIAVWSRRMPSAAPCTALDDDIAAFIAA